jgi:FkbM family methyltransferase
VTIPLVFDLGMHDGQDTAFYLSQGYRVVAVECNPRLVQDARRKFAREIAAGLLTIEAIGLWFATGLRTFHVNPRNTQWSSFDAGAAGRDGKRLESFTVHCEHPAYLFAKYGVPYYCKVDLEGCDRAVLDALSALDERPPYLSIEMCDVTDAYALSALGYREVRLVDQRENTNASNPSGPFGPALGGAWVSADEAAAAYVAGRERAPLAWFDLHGRLAA